MIFLSRSICLFLIAVLSVPVHPVLGLQFKGADISSLTVVEDAGITFQDTNGSPGDALDIMKAHGLNTARVRVWTAGTYNTDYGVALAKRIKAAGMTLIVDLHFSDTWADPGHQATPVAWGSGLVHLNHEIRNYTKSIVTTFRSEGVPIDILQIGNEINNGLLWPTGMANSTADWSAASQFLHSARNGAQDAGFQGKVMIHLADGWSESEQLFFWDNIFIPGAFSLRDFDMLGVSFYPFYGTSATISNLTTSLHAVLNKIDKDIMVAETDYPAIACSTALSASFPNSPAGQIDWQQAITSVLGSLPDGHGKGTLYWEPSWVGSAALGSSCPDNLLFDETGKARSSISIFDDM